ncbi:YdcF family protein [Rodentibacter haemolyticus]|uniref:YdcF family protein n=1 Tax=Rodentibacter haemolyticus TaxID=2778911 RepID=A0ABX6UZB9_9PAST|nr:YdcF family protein [Rodentibacter haemolyticus]QPB42723.1 YdcF family protein [Rodentibacter haemolyticus]
MMELKKLVTAIILPPFNVLILWLLALIFAKLNFKKLSRISTALGIGLLYILSIPFTAQTLKDSLITEDHLTLEDYKQAQAIVLLGGGLRDSKELYAPLASTAIQLERLRYAAYLQKETALPLLITGASPTGAIEAKVAAKELQYFFNVSTKWIEPRALTTKENAFFTKEILAKKHINKIVLVTNEWHMQRATLLFQKQGFEVLPASVGEGITPTHYGLNIMHFIPQGGALAKNMQLLKEWIGYLKER